MNCICVICLNNFQCLSTRKCRYIYCKNVICRDCSSFTDRMKHISYPICSIKCLIPLITNTICWNKYNYINDLDLYDSGIEKDQTEIYELIINTKICDKLILIGYPNVLAKIISEY